MSTPERKTSLTSVSSGEHTMNISPHDFPDTKARDADPASMPFGPQSPDRQTGIANDLTLFSGVSQTILQHAWPNGRGPIEIVLIGDDNTDPVTVRENVANDLERFLPDGHVSRVEETPVGRNQAVPIDATIVGSVLIWRHPLVPHIESILDNHGLVYDFTLTWKQSASSLGFSPATTRWSSIDPLYVELDGPTDQIDTVVDEVMEAVISTVPRPSITTVETDIDPQTIPREFGSRATGETALQFAFTDREVMHKPSSGVYNIPAEHLSEAVTAAVSNPITPAAPGIETSSDAPSETGVQLTITSPPYLDAIDYETYAKGNGDDWSRKHGVSIDGADNSMDEDQLVELWKKQQRGVFEEVFEATRDGGYCAVVIGHVKMEKDSWVPLPHEFSSVMRDIGWEFHERIIWTKIGSRSSRFGTTIQHPHGTYYYPNQIHEEIMIWRKGDIERRKPDSEELEISTLMKQEVANNVWHVPPVPHNKGVNHPCPFPEELVHRLTVLYSCPGDIVVDPMAGSGTTVKIADRLGRVGVGTELQPAFVAEARRRLAIESYERGNQLLPSYERIPGDVEEAQLTRSVAMESGKHGVTTDGSPSKAIEDDSSNLSSNESEERTRPTAPDGGTKTENEASQNQQSHLFEFDS